MYVCKSRLQQKLRTNKITEYTQTNCIVQWMTSFSIPNYSRLTLVCNSYCYKYMPHSADISSRQQHSISYSCKLFSLAVKLHLLVFYRGINKNSTVDCPPLCHPNYWITAAH